MNEQSMERVVREFNELVNIGDSVVLIEDKGSRTTTRTRSEAWIIGSGAALVKVEGKTGGYDLTRIRI